MDSRFNFNGMEFFTCNNLDHEENYGLNLKERNVPTTATDEDDLMLEIPFYQKSTQNLT